MQEIFKNFREDFKKYNKLSKYILQFGTSILTGLIIFALSVRLYSAVNSVDCSVQLFYEDLRECIKESFGAIYLSAFILEFLHLNINK